MTDLEVIEEELAQYVPDETLGGRPLAERTRIVVLNKADVPEAHELAEMVKPDLEARGIEVFIVSAVAHTGLRELMFAMARHVGEARKELELATAVPKRLVIRPRSVDDSGFAIIRENTPDGEVFRIDGERPTRWVRQTDFSNDRAHRPQGQRGRLRLGAHPRGRRRAARCPWLGPAPRGPRATHP